MKRSGIVRIVISAVLSVALSLSGAQAAQAGMKDLRHGAEEDPAKEERIVVTYSGLLPAGIGAQQSGEALTEDELAELRKKTDSRDAGFFTAFFDRPEEIDWTAVLRGGAGLSCADAGIRTAFEAAGEKITGNLIALRDSDIRSYVKKKTGTDYALARRPVWTDYNWTYLPDYDVYCRDCSEPEEEPVYFAAGSRDGDVYRLQYTAQEYGSGEFRDFVLTARIDRAGRWSFISNVPAEAPAPLTLADIRFFEDEDAAMKSLPGKPAAEVEIEVKDYDEPYGWYGAVITAREDIGLELSRTDFSKDYRYELQWSGAGMPDELLYTGYLKKGESIVCNVNLPWHPGIRLDAWTDDFYGTCSFGEDNYLHLGGDTHPPVDRYITGYAAGMGARGVDPRSIEELREFLMGGWIWFDPETLEPAATLQFAEDGSVYYDVLPEQGEVYGELRSILDWEMNAETAAPDVITFFANDDAYSSLPGKEELRGGLVGSYRIYAEQSVSAQILHLKENGDGTDTLSRILPGAQKGEDLRFYRYTGRMTWKSAYKDLLKRLRLDALEGAGADAGGTGAGAEYGGVGDGLPEYYCLYDINKNGIPELFVKTGFAEASSALTIYTFTDSAEACALPGGESVLGFSHGSLYTAPATDEEERGGVLIWQGHMGWAAIRMLQLEYVDLAETLLHEEDINEAWSRGEETGFTQPWEIVPGASPLPQFEPDNLLPIDMYGLWFAQARMTDPIDPKCPTALDPEDAYGKWMIGQYSAGADDVPGGKTQPDREAEQAAPYWMKDCIENNGIVNVVSADPYTTDAGAVCYDDLFAEDVLYPYMSGPFEENGWRRADLDGDGIREGILYLAESGEDRSSLRVIFRRSGGEIYAFTSVCWGDMSGTVLKDGTLVRERIYGETDRERALFRKGESFVFPVD